MEKLEFVWFFEKYILIQESMSLLWVLFFFILSAIYLKAFLIQYFTISYLVFLDFLNFLSNTEIISEYVYWSSKSIKAYFFMSFSSLFIFTIKYWISFLNKSNFTQAMYMYDLFLVSIKVILSRNQSSYHFKFIFNFFPDQGSLLPLKLIFQASFMKVLDL